jgi:putative transposase
MRKVAFANGEYYHIYNRGTDKRDVFLDDLDYHRFLTSLREFNDIKPIGSLYEKSLREKNGVAFGGSTSIMEVEPPKARLVEIICYCLNPNHYHFILKQLEDDGIKKFMHRLGTAYTMFFNNKYKRSGVLFQGKFKAINIDSNEYLLYLSAYVNQNNFIHGYSKDNSWSYSSFLDYIEKRNGTLCEKENILSQFNNAEEYKNFVNVNALYLKGKKEEQKYLLEE